jgi:hypothetical protein
VSECKEDRTMEMAPVGGAKSIAATWPCRYCRAPTDVTAFAVQGKAVFDRALKARGERPLDCSTIVVCERCELKHQEAQMSGWQKEKAAQIAEIAASIRCEGEAARGIIRSPLSSKKQIEAAKKWLIEHGMTP